MEQYDEDLNTIISELIIDSLMGNDPEEFWRVIDTIITVAVASAAYKFGTKKQTEVIDHFVNLVLDTYEVQKHFHIDTNSVNKPKLH